jgi:hypothetical protein
MKTMRLCPGAAVEGSAAHHNHLVVSAAALKCPAEHVREVWERATGADRVVVVEEYVAIVQLARRPT